MRPFQTLIIAEIGVNHNGSIDTAKRLVDAAAAAGADIVKFQAFTADKLVLRGSELAAYQKKNSLAHSDQFALLESLQLSNEYLIELKHYTENIGGLKFLVSAFDVDALRLFCEFSETEYIKIPSGEITNYPFLLEVGSLDKHIILSTGMSTLTEIKDAIDILEIKGKRNITLLHCNSQYPTELEDLNLRVIPSLRQDFSRNVGLSDHSLSIVSPMIAVGLGATIIEKHLTLDRSALGPDHCASLMPEEFKKMVIGIREAEKSLGIAKKHVTESERKNRKIVRKSIAASRKIFAGEVMDETNLHCIRPGTGVCASKWFEVLGTMAHQDYEANQLLKRV